MNLKQGSWVSSGSSTGWLDFGRNQTIGLSRYCFIFEPSWQAPFTRKVMIGAAVLQKTRFDELFRHGVKIEHSLFLSLIGLDILVQLPEY